MSSFLKNLINPKTGKEQVAYCIDNYFGGHQYGYFFHIDGKDAILEAINMQDNEYDIFTEDQINCNPIVNITIDDCKQGWEEDKEYDRFIRKGLFAGFTDDQVNFLWEYFKK